MATATAQNIETGKVKAMTLLNHFEKAQTNLPDFAKEIGVHEHELYSLLHADGAVPDDVILINGDLYTRASRYTANWSLGKKPKITPFTDYINDAFDGDIAEFCKDLGENRQFALNALEDDAYWVNDEILLPVSLIASWEATPIRMYADQVCGGNATALARAYDVRQQQLYRWIEKDCFFCRGEFYMRRTEMGSGDPHVKTIAIPLKDYIRNAFGPGNEGIRLFGTEHDMITQQVKRYIGYDSMWINGDIYKNQSDFAINGIVPNFDKAFTPRKKRSKSKK